MKGRWCFGMGERKEKKRKRGGCGSDQGLYETRVVCVWNGGTDQIGMGMQGKGRDETNYKRKEKKKRYTPGFCDRSPCAYAGILGPGDC